MTSNIARNNLAQVYVVRPHNDRIRSRMFETLTELGFDMANAEVLAPGTPDEAVVQHLCEAPANSLVLVPFHQHSDTEGTSVNGLQLVSQLRARDLEVANAVFVMPLSIFSTGFALVEGRLRRAGALDTALMNRILLVPEKAIQRPDFAAQVSKHVEMCIGSEPFVGL